MNATKQNSVAYAPLMFLGALGNGGLAVSFFVWLTFVAPHKGSIIISQAHIQALWERSGWDVRALLAIALTGLILFTLRHFQRLIWNLIQYRRFKRTEAYANLIGGNAEASLMVIPLTLAMSVNVVLAAGAALVPGLWEMRETLFPFAMGAFALIGAAGLHRYVGYLSRALTSGGIDCEKNNNFAQLMPAFAFAMVAVGFAAPAAMSHVKGVSMLAAVGAIFFLNVAVAIALMKFMTSFRAVMAKGVDKDTSVTLWIVIPILTLVGITIIRVLHGVHHHLGGPMSPAGLFLLTTTLLSGQLLFGLIGWITMQRNGFFAERKCRCHVSDYALVCPGVALFIFGMFFLFAGLVKNGVVTPFSPLFFVLLAPLAWLQVKTILTLFSLDRQLPRLRETGDDGVWAGRCRKACA
ncbi:TsoY family (seleno)protein [Magnetofaba australis]|uniref:Voltage-dependent anion channel n=1 Tax=Magnetofaba australis IT-1 TaxID=1434232 RepID=A0A1Y2K2N3_9PROT|nr:hypothetical protein [Magnetofaba australis]OSM02209.1 hypothetical protein MAIT1_02313 [Magnetofaba australis IT-1]